MTKFIQLLSVTILFTGVASTAFGQSDAKPSAPAKEEAAPGSQAKSKTDTISLFDGTNLDHWRGYKTEAIGADWKIQPDGSLMFDGGKGHGGDLVTKEAFANFVLTFDWKVSEGANSGVMYRVGLGDNAPYFTGPEYQVLDDDKHQDGVHPKHRSGSLYGLYEATGKKLNAVGEWNSAKIVLNGNKVEHWLNGTKVVDAEMYSQDWDKQVAASKFSKWKKFATLKSGHIAFQDHGDQVWYRNISIQKLAPQNAGE